MSKSSMSRSRFSGLPALALLCTLCVAPELQAESRQPLVSVTGQASLYRQPDMLTFTLFVEEKGEVVSKLHNSVEQKTSQIVQFLLQQELEEKDIQSMQINLYPWYQRDPNHRQQQKGFVLNRQINVKLRDLDLYVKVLDGLTRLGVTQISGFRYLLEDQEQAYLDALALALKDAQKRADKMAASIGIKLGEVVGINEASGRYPVAFADAGVMHSRVESSPTPSNSAGEIQISASVSVDYQINH